MRGLIRPPIPKMVPFARRIGQLVEVRPEVKIEAPITVGFGDLPLSIGLFAGSATVFLVRTALPEGWPKAVALGLGGLLAAGGVANLLIPKGEAAVTPGVPKAVVPGETPITTRAYVPPPEDAFALVTGRIVAPTDFSTVNVGPTESSYPVRFELENPASQPVSFEVLLVADENPSIGSETQTSLPVTVTVPPGGAIAQFDVEMPLTSWGWYADTSEVFLRAFKRRSPASVLEKFDEKKFLID